MRTEMEGVISLHTGRSPEDVDNDIERDRLRTAADATEYGLLEAVLPSRKVASA
jgi:ATP-dependent Clp protease protease subunit